MNSFKEYNILYSLQTEKIYLTIPASFAFIFNYLQN